MHLLQCRKSQRLKNVEKRQIRAIARTLLAVADSHEVSEMTEIEEDPQRGGLDSYTQTDIVHIENGQDLDLSVDHTDLPVDLENTRRGGLEAKREIPRTSRGNLHRETIAEKIQRIV
jgi:hypothetical protein